MQKLITVKVILVVLEIYEYLSKIKVGNIRPWNILQILFIGQRRCQHKKICISYNYA